VSRARKERDLNLLKQHSAQLSEHFESVQIFATRRADDATISATYGDGNWFARYGQVRRWVAMNEQPQQEEFDDGEDDDE
jgi:hypothetical protein